MALSKDKGVEIKTGSFLDSPYLRQSTSGTERHSRSLSFTSTPNHRGGARKASLSFQMGVDAYIRNREAEVREKLNNIRPLSGSAQNLTAGITPPVLKPALSVPNLHALMNNTTTGEKTNTIPPSRAPVRSDQSYNTVSSLASSQINQSTGALDISTIFPSSIRYSDLDASNVSVSSGFNSNAATPRVSGQNEDDILPVSQLPPQARSLLRTSSADPQELHRQLSSLHLRQLESPMPTHNHRNKQMLQQALLSGQKLTKEQLAELHDSGFAGAGTPLSMHGKEVLPLDPQRLSIALSNHHHPNASSFSLSADSNAPPTNGGALTSSKRNSLGATSAASLSDPTCLEPNGLYVNSSKSAQLYAPSPMPPVLADEGRELAELSGLKTSSAAAAHAASAPVSLTLSPSQSLAPVTEADVAHAKGFGLRRVGDFVGAIAEYTRAVELDPNHFKAYFNRGFAYDKIREFSKAVQDYSRALEIDPDNAYAFYNRGIAYDRAGQWGLAIEDFTKAIKILPNYADFYHNRGFCYRKQGRYDLAVVDYSEAIRLNDKHFKAVYNRAFSYDKMGKYKEAIADYSRAIELEPMNANAYHNRGSTYDKVRIGLPTFLALSLFLQSSCYLMRSFFPLKFSFTAIISHMLIDIPQPFSILIVADGPCRRIRCRFQ